MVDAAVWWLPTSPSLSHTEKNALEPAGMVWQYELFEVCGTLVFKKKTLTWEINWVSPDELNQDVHHCSQMPLCDK